MRLSKLDSFLGGVKLKQAVEISGCDGAGRGFCSIPCVLLDHQPENVLADKVEVHCCDASQGV